MSAASEMTEWQLHDAKNKFSAVVNAAVKGRPQRVTRRGKPAVVVLGMEEFEHLAHLRRATSASLPDLLLDMPQDSGVFNRLDLQARRVGL